MAMLLQAVHVASMQSSNRTILKQRSQVWSVLQVIYRSCAKSWCFINAGTFQCKEQNFTFFVALNIGTIISKLCLQKVSKSDKSKIHVLHGQSQKSEPPALTHSLVTPISLQTSTVHQIVPKVNSLLIKAVDYLTGHRAMLLKLYNTDTYEEKYVVKTAPCNTGF